MEANAKYLRDVGPCSNLNKVLMHPTGLAMYIQVYQTPRSNDTDDTPGLLHAILWRHLILIPIYHANI